MACCCCCCCCKCSHMPPTDGYSCMKHNWWALNGVLSILMEYYSASTRYELVGLPYAKFSRKAVGMRTFSTLPGILYIRELKISTWTVKQLNLTQHTEQWIINMLDELNLLFHRTLHRCARNANVTWRKNYKNMTPWLWCHGSRCCHNRMTRDLGLCLTVTRTQEIMSWDYNSLLAKIWAPIMSDF